MRLKYLDRIALIVAPILAWTPKLTGRPDLFPWFYGAAILVALWQPLRWASLSSKGIWSRPIRRLMWQMGLKAEVYHGLSSISPLAYPIIAWIEFEGTEIYIQKGYNAFLTEMNQATGELLDSFVKTAIQEAKPFENYTVEDWEAFQRRCDDFRKQQEEQEVIERQRQIDKIETALKSAKFKNGETTLWKNKSKGR